MAQVSQALMAVLHITRFRWKPLSANSSRIDRAEVQRPDFLRCCRNDRYRAIKEWKNWNFTPSPSHNKWLPARGQLLVIQIFGAQQLVTGDPSLQLWEPSDSHAAANAL